VGAGAVQVEGPKIEALAASRPLLAIGDIALRLYMAGAGLVFVFGIAAMPLLGGAYLISIISKFSIFNAP
jgi:hypothetical protein